MSSKRIAVYEPDPRICGPDAWAQHLRWGFRELGHDCHVVASTKTGRAPVRWGRLLQDKGPSQSCALAPDVAVSHNDLPALLDTYDLVVLTDVKCPTVDMEETPIYLWALEQTQTKWTSALHGKWYFELDEVPPGVDFARGSPHLARLLDLPNFSGFLIEHAADGLFSQHSARLRRTRREYLPLPYRLTVDESQISERDPRRIAALGRTTKIKFKHLLNWLAIRGDLDGYHVVMGGAASVTHGPNESYELYEHLCLNDFDGWRNGGTKSATPWTVRRGDATVEYYGIYEHPMDVCRGCTTHVGLTDGTFSGGLLEFSTLEAIDCGCVPIITQQFTTPYTGLMDIGIVPYDLHGHHTRVSVRGINTFSIRPDETAAQWCDSLLNEIHWAPARDWRLNRLIVKQKHDPRRHAEIFLRETGTC